MSASSPGAEISTRFAPAVRWAEALSRAVKRPVHSSAISTPSSFQGSFAGSRSARTLIGPRPRSIEDLVVLILPGKGPCTLSYFSRRALASTDPRSLIATTSISLRPDSAMARSTRRPIRPNPLIATRTAIFLSPERELGLFREARLCRSHCRLGGNVEMLVEFRGRRGGAEARHADEGAIKADIAVPAVAYGRLDRDLDRILTEHLRLEFPRLLIEDVEAG